MSKNVGYLWNMMRVRAGQNAGQAAAQEARNLNSNAEIAEINKLIELTNRENPQSTPIPPEISKPIKDFSDNDIYELIPNGLNTVDIVKDFSWTPSPKGSIDDINRNDVPYLYMKEYSLAFGADVQRLIYGISVGVDVFEKGANKIGDLIGAGDLGTSAIGLMENATGGLVDKLTQKPSEKKQQPTFDKMKDTSLKVYNSIKDKITKKMEKIKGYQRYEDIHHLNPYNLMYLCNDKPLWSYKIPFFIDEVFSTKHNQWGENSGQGKLFNTIASYVENQVNKWAGKLGIFEQLTSNKQLNIEFPKIYQAGSDSNQFSIKFPLINTISKEDAIKNWQLVYMLKYQSRPYKYSKSMIISPYIYEISIPGIRYIPYAQLVNAQIELKGVRRQIIMPYLLQGKQQTTLTTIPEAYEVTITLQSLTNDTRNMMIESLINERKMY